MKMVHVSIFLPKELVGKLRYAAEQENRSISGLVRVWIRRHIEELEKKNGGVSL